MRAISGSGGSGDCQVFGRLMLNSETFGPDARTTVIYGGSAGVSGENSHEESGLSLTPSYFLGVLKRRALYFIIPFLLIALIGSIATIAWPSRYLSRGDNPGLISGNSSDLVRPTVAALANDRIQIIQQRIMTRNNLLAIGRKFQIAPFWQSQMSGSDLADFIRSRTEITAVADQLLASAGTRKNAIAFKVGFEYEKPQIAVGVANKVVTMILN